jgi:ankyrin repeat protein
MGNYNFKKLVDNIMKNNNFKFNKILEICDNDNFHEKLKKLLLNFDINTCDKYGRNLLHKFANTFDQFLLKILIDNGCDINKKDNLGQTPIFYAEQNTINFFIENGTDLCIKNNHGHTVLYENSRFYSVISIKSLLNAQKNSDVYTNNNFEKHELLHKAVLFQDIPKMKELLTENNLLVNSLAEKYSMSKEIKLLTPLQITCINGLYPEFLCLLDYGADIRQNNLLMEIMNYNYYFNKNHINIIKKLIELGINVNDIDNYGKNLLHKCCILESHELIEIFLNSGVNIYGKTEIVTINQINYTAYNKLARSNAEPLQYLTSYGCKNIKIYEILFKYGADPNVQNNFGINAFMCLCKYNIHFISLCGIDIYYEIMKLFIDNDINIYLTDCFGKSALDIICNNIYILYDFKIKIIKYLHQKFNFIIANQKTNQFIYDVFMKNKLNY